MDWAYLAGFFDSNGNINLIRVKDKDYIQIRFYSSNKELLEEIKQFLGCGNIYSRKLNKKNPQWSDAFELSITAKKEIFLLLNNMLAHLIIKQDEVNQILSMHPHLEDLRSPQEEKREVSYIA